MTNPVGGGANPFGSLGGPGGLQPTGPTPSKSKRKLAPSTPLGAGVIMVAVLGLLWVLEVVDYGVGHWLDRLGIHALDFEGLPGILAAPFLHLGFGHLASNSLPLLILGWLALLGGLARFVVATLLIVLVSGLFAWLLTAPGTVIIGASGVIFGWLGYLIARGVFERRVVQILVAVGVLVVYGGMIVGLLPGTPGVSWQAHLGGFVGGVGAAWLISRRARAKRAAAKPPAPPGFPGSPGSPGPTGTAGPSLPRT